VRDQILQPQNTIDKISFIYIPVFILLDMTGTIKIAEVISNCSCKCIFALLLSSPNMYLNLAIFLRIHV
jgi:hypothetical protein